MHQWTSCFNVLAIVNNAAVNLGLQVYFQVSVFVSFGKMPSSGIDGSYGSSSFILLGTFHTVWNGPI